MGVGCYTCKTFYNNTHYLQAKNIIHTSFISCFLGNKTFRVDNKFDSHTIRNKLSDNINWFLTADAIQLYKIRMVEKSRVGKKHLIWKAAYMHFQVSRSSYLRVFPCSTIHINILQPMSEVCKTVEFSTLI